jgi:hypothetical protein
MNPNPIVVTPGVGNWIPVAKPFKVMVFAVNAIAWSLV